MDPKKEVRTLSTIRGLLPYILIVILLAAVVLAVISLTMPSQCSGPCSYTPSAVPACTGETVTITYQGEGQYPSSVVNISAYDTDPSGTRTMGGIDGLLPVGSRLVLEGPFFSPAHIVAVAQMQDGAKMVILETRMECGSGPKRTAP